MNYKVSLTIKLIFLILITKKVFSNWPTIPQLYVNKEFIGGSDIMVELYQSGELAEMIEVLKAS